jgi:hypothetical protein
MVHAVFAIAEDFEKTGQVALRRPADNRLGFPVGVASSHDRSRQDAAPTIKETRLF